MPPAATAAEKAANNVVLLLVSRWSMALMPVIFGAVMWVGQTYIAASNERSDRIEATARLTAEALSRLELRVTVVETTAEATQDAWALERISQERFQSLTTAKLDRLNDGVASLSSQVAALMAIMRERGADSVAFTEGRD